MTCPLVPSTFSANLPKLHVKYPHEAKAMAYHALLSPYTYLLPSSIRQTCAFPIESDFTGLKTAKKGDNSDQA